MALSNDLPISEPDDDRFGLNPFAKALAQSISGMEAPQGAVLAINGAWGAGKSSAINLVRHHLKPAITREELVLVPFNPWWFAGADALTLAFFQELNKAIGPSLPAALRSSLALMGQGVSAVGAVAGALANLKAPGVGEVVAGLAEWFGKVTASEKTVEGQHQEVSKALAAQQKRFLVIIDDIDRLSPDDALTIFRLVKSVGRLPNVIYLLAFDRQIAERIVTERFPSEGPSYLEKILQASFELPPPAPDLLRRECAEMAFKIMGAPDAAKHTRFWNVFHDVVAPTIRTPRDVARLGNQLSASWPAVANEVDRADFLAVTSLQLAEPGVYAVIRQHPNELCGLGQNDGRRRDTLGAEYDVLFGLSTRSERDARRLRIALRRLFPRLDAVWGSTYHSGDNWRRDRLIAASQHFRSYFAFSISDDNLPAETIEEIISRAGEREFIEATFRRALSVIRRSGGTQAALLLDEATIYAADIAEADVGTFVATLFALADELDVDSDVSRGFAGIADNSYRLHWLLNRLVNDRFPMLQREELYRSAMEGASVGWAADFAERCQAYYQPREGGQDRGEPIVSEAVAQEFVLIALGKFRAAGEAGNLAQHPRLIRLLYAWRRMAGEPGIVEVRAWVDRNLCERALIVSLARQMPSSSWSYGMGIDEMGDRVQRETRLVDTEAFEGLFDVAGFEARVHDELSGDQLTAVERSDLQSYLALPRGSHGRRSQD